MREGDLARLERELAIRLPRQYRECMCNSTGRVRKANEIVDPFAIATNKENVTRGEGRRQLPFLPVQIEQQVHIVRGGGMP